MSPEFGKGMLAEALSKVTPCKVIAPIGKCYPVDDKGKKVDEDNPGPEVAGNSEEGMNTWNNGEITETTGPVPY